MAAYQFDVIHSASRLVRGRLVVERIEDAGGSQLVQWAYVEPAESTSVRACGMGSWDRTGRNVVLTERNILQGGATIWGSLSEFYEAKAKLGTLYSLAVQSSGHHAAALTAVENSSCGSSMALVKQGAVRPRTRTQAQAVLQRTIITPSPQPVAMSSQAPILPTQGFQPGQMARVQVAPEPLTRSQFLEVNSR